MHCTPSEPGNRARAGGVRSAEALRVCVGKMCLPLICPRSLKQSRKDDLTAVELGWDTSVPKLLLRYTV